MQRAVVIRCDAGGHYGLGHASRCAALARSFRSRGYDVKLVVQPGAPEGAAFLVEQGFDVSVSPALAGSAPDQRFVGTVCQGPKPPILILDSRDLSDVKEYRQHAAVLVCIDDETPRNFNCDVIINPHPWISHSDYLPGAARRLLIGPTFSFVDPLLFTIKPPADPPSRVLITMGGEDPRNHSLQILQVCFQELRDMNLSVVVGPAHPDPVSVSTAAIAYPNATVHMAPKGLSYHIELADIVLTAGGTSCYEIAAAGRPMGAVAIEPHQETLVRALAKESVVMRIDDDGKINPSAVTNLLNNAKLRQRLNAKCRSLMPAAGLERIVDSIASVALENIWRS